MNRYFMVANEPWGYHGIKYRRHYLMEFLASQAETDRVFFICRDSRLPVPLATTPIAPKITEIALNDHGLALLIDQLNDKPDWRLFQNILFYCDPRFAWELCSMPIWDKIVYDCTDFWSNSPFNQTDRNTILLQEAMIAAKSEPLFASSQFLANHLRKAFHKQATVIENGVAIWETEPMASDVPEQFTVQSPGLVFAGGMKEKIDFDLLFNVARLMPDAHFYLMGPLAGRLSKKQILGGRLPSNLRYLGSFPPEAVPSLLKRFDVGLIPHRRLEYSKAVSPLKFFEYLYAGLPVVSCNAPSIDHYAESGIAYPCANNQFSFAIACRWALAVAKDETLIAKRKAIARGRAWDSLFTQMLKRILAA
jgi:teichuronic acid biosynthesis glycosyltransferase TuaH